MTAILGLAAMACAVTPTGTAFTYQGQLKQNGSPITGSVDCQFSLFDGPAGGSPINGLTLSQNLTATDGLFTTDLDFGAGALIGEERWLGIAVRYPAGSGNYIPLVPRQRLNPAPYSLFALNAMVFGTQGGAVNFTNASNAFAGSGSGLTNLNASSINSGTLGSAQMSGAYSNALHFSNASNVFIGSFSGDGAGLTGVNADLLDGLDSTAFLQTVPLPFSGSAASPNAVFKATNTGTGYGVSGESGGNDGAIAVYGLATATFGLAHGGWFETRCVVGNGVVGQATSPFGENFGVVGESLSISGTGIRGYNSVPTGSTIGGAFDVASPSGRALDVHNFGTTGESLAAHFQSDSPTGIGIYAVSPNATGNSRTIYAHNVSASGNAITGIASSPGGGGIGVAGESSGNFLAIGVAGTASAPTGSTFGLYGQNNSTAGVGCLALATATSGATFGARFLSASPAGTGVYGSADATTGFNFGGLFNSNSPDGRAIRSVNSATTGQAVAGRFSTPSNAGLSIWSSATAATGATYGVFGEAVSASGFGVWAQGRLGASGTKSFRIDHPDDPTNKYLLHYSAESPEVINFYSGKVIINGLGEAVVELPHYFARINKDPRYTLTAVGASMPNLYVAEEIDDAALLAGKAAGPGEAAMPCWFRIAGGAPGAKVCWRVEAVRNDHWMQERGAPVEIDKQDLERGTYQHPEFYGQPAEKGMKYDATLSEPAEGHDIPHR